MVSIEQLWSRSLRAAVNERAADERAVTGRSAAVPLSCRCVGESFRGAGACEHTDSDEAATSAAGGALSLSLPSVSLVNELQKIGRERSPSEWLLSRWLMSDSPVHRGHHRCRLSGR